MSKLFDFDEGFGKIILGTDEAGRGPAAGGVFAACVCFKEKSAELVNELAKLNDSKKLSKKCREELYDIIKLNTFNSVVNIEVDEIEKINILNASLKAMKLACENVFEQLKVQQNEVLTLVDGNKLIKNYNLPQKFVIKGDAQSASIAGASILAKVSRDWYMENLDKEFPEYGWASNAGYLSAKHIEAIDKYGLCKYHRPSFLKKHFAKKQEGAQETNEVQQLTFLT